MTTQQQLLDDEGQVRADLGANAARNGVHSWWRIAAEATIADLAASGEEFTAEDVRDRVGTMVGRESALAAAFRVASRAGLITAVGWRTARRPEAHQRALRIWRGAR